MLQLHNKTYGRISTADLVKEQKESLNLSMKRCHFKKKNEENLWDIQNSIKKYIHYWSPRMKREGEGVRKLILKTMIENFQNLGGNLDNPHS